jgi:hypothetical protein
MTEQVECQVSLSFEDFTFSSPSGNFTYEKMRASNTATQDSLRDEVSRLMNPYEKHLQKVGKILHVESVD